MTVGLVVVQVSELSLENLKECNAHVWRTCYRFTITLKKMEEEMTTRSRAMADKIQLQQLSLLLPNMNRDVKSSAALPIICTLLNTV